MRSPLQMVNEPWLYRHSRSLLALFAGTGTLLTFYLTVNKLAAQEVAFCGTGAGCDLVLTSRWATFLGLPTALWGLLGFLGVLFLALWPDVPRLLKQWRWPLLFGLTTSMFVFELYMLYLMVGVIRAFCLYCTAAILLTTAIWIVTLSGRQWLDVGKLTFNGILLGLATVVVTAAVYANQTPPPSPLATGLAQHLQSIRGTMYGAHWCPHCQAQKEMFGAAFATVPYVECSPDGGPGTPQAPACREREVRTYPTWIINGQKYEGEKPLEELAKLSGYEAAPAKSP